MKTLLFLLILSHQLLANSLIVNIAREEEFLALRKIGGPRLFLNTEIINSLSETKLLIPVKSFSSNLKKSNTPSYLLIHELFIHGKSIFKIKNKNDARIYKKMRKEILEIFLGYINEIQKLMPKHDCLDKSIPHFSEIKSRIRYLNSDFPINTLLDKNDVTNLLTKLKDPQKLISSCKAN